MTMSDNDHQEKVCAKVRPAVMEDLNYLLQSGYVKTEIVNEGIRLFAAKKKAEASA